MHVYRRDYGRYGLGTPKQAVADAIGVLQKLGRDFDDERIALARAFVAEMEVPSSKEASKLRAIGFFASQRRGALQNRRVLGGVDRARLVAHCLSQIHRQTAANCFRAESAYAAHPIRGTPSAWKTLTAIAIQNLDDHMGRIKGKAIARAVAKFAVGKTAQVAGAVEGNQTGDLVALGGVLWNWGNAIAEEADKRSWITLPSEIGVSELYANPGKTTVDVDFMTAGGQVVEHAAFDVEVKPGETTFLSYRTFL